MTCLMVQGFFLIFLWFSIVHSSCILNNKLPQEGYLTMMSRLLGPSNMISKYQKIIKQKLFVLLN